MSRDRYVAHPDAETDRHYAAAWRVPAAEAPDPAPPSTPREDTPEADPGWLLGDDEPSRGGDAVTEALPQGRPPRRRRWLWPGVAAVLVLALVGGVFFARDLWPVLFPPDYDGPGTGRVVVEVADGSSTRAIGEELVAADVVASARAFGDAAEENPNGRAIQPGFYELRRQMSSAGAVAALLDPATRVGRLDIRSGTQLDDTVGVGTEVVPGVLSQIARATCTVDESGAERCATVDELRAAMAGTDPAELGVPSWAQEGVRRAEPNRRLEGLLAPGPYDIAPGTGAREALEAVVRASAPRLEAGGLVEEARAAGLQPYDALIVGSLAEREGVPADFGKVTRVIVNRLAVPMRLQFDSTVNYPLDRQTLLTSPYDRARPGPYNTYLNLGLTPTPIGAVSPDALRAALDPEPGPWVYFVKCQADGISCFAVTPAEHDANRRLAQERGVY
ncbi:endolytic transglycosylase MltG [Actinomycetospora lutea]|uniref:endolytic transglycosylase MltG n=1 Tax=Actinomycetospora lutea TaxID=663604 RepID=UPI0023653323|nr:endolytic transglycosylase MltG [Actinomycetospora lutea]MDD7937597.1 endolytic transglycosylase MltG [Actinomycetospora lutea]